MFSEEAASRACATVATREPLPVRIQNVVRLSWSGLSSPFEKYAYCVSSVAIRAPYVPECAATVCTEAVPVPWVPPVQFEKLPLSKPSAKARFVYCPSAGLGVTAADAAESAPVPTAFVAATRNVYAVLFVRFVTSKLVVIPPGTVIGV